MTKQLLVTDIVKSQHKSGFLEILPLDETEPIVLSVHTCQLLFDLFIRWGIIDIHQLKLAIRNIEYRRG